jgi:FkbM family methyltransferase
MQRNEFQSFGRRIELWTHPEPDHLARVISSSRTWYEADVLMKCREIYLPGTVIVDVGANIGNHTVFFGSILGATVHAFEPYQPNYDLLVLNIAVNGLENRVVAHPFAVADRDGLGSAQPGLTANHGIVRVRFGDGNIPVRSLDSLPIPGPIGILKIDVEGSEAIVLRGAESLIRTWLPDILVEAASANEFAAVADVLLGHGYVPRGRYAWTATYLFSAIDQMARMDAILHGPECSAKAASSPRHL